EECTGNFSAAHEPDVLPGVHADLVHQRGRGFPGEDQAFALARRQRARHDIALEVAAEAAPSAHGFRDVIGFAPHDGGVDGGEKVGHGVVLGHEEEIDCAVGTGDVAVKTDAETQDHFAHRERL